VLDCARVRPLTVEADQKRDCAWASIGMCAGESGGRQTKGGVIQQGPRRSEVSIARMPVHKRARGWTSLDRPVQHGSLLRRCRQHGIHIVASQAEAASLSDREQESLIAENAADAPPAGPFERGPPGNQRELPRMLDNGKASTGERNAAAIGAAHILPPHGFDIVEPSLLREPRASARELPALQGRKEIAGVDDLIVRLAREALVEQPLAAPIERCLDLDAKAGGAHGCADVPC